MWSFKPKLDFQILPYIENKKLIIDISQNNSEYKPIKVPLADLFEQFLSYRRYWGGELQLDDRKEVVEMVALLRFIAKELETELNGAS